MPKIEKKKNCYATNSVSNNKRALYKTGSLMEWYKNKAKSRKSSNHITRNNSNENGNSTSANKETENQKNENENIVFFKLDYMQKENLIKCEKNQVFSECVKDFNKNNFIFLLKGKVIETDKTIKELEINNGDVIGVGEIL